MALAAQSYLNPHKVMLQHWLSFCCNPKGTFGPSTLCTHTYGLKKDGMGWESNNLMMWRSKTHRCCFAFCFSAMLLLSSFLSLATILHQSGQVRELEKNNKALIVDALI